MSSTYFDLESSSSGRRLYIQLRYSTFHVHQYEQSSRQKSVIDAITALYRTIPKLYILPYSWRWIFGFETHWRYQKIRH